MSKHFAIYSKKRVTLDQHGFDGYVLVQTLPNYFETVKQAESFIENPINHLFGKGLFIIEEHAVLKVK